MANDQSILNALQRTVEDQEYDPTQDPTDIPQRELATEVQPSGIDPRLEDAINQRKKQELLAGILGSFQQAIGAGAAGTGYKTDMTTANRIAKNAGSSVDEYKAIAKSEKDARDKAQHEQVMKLGRIKIGKQQLDITNEKKTNDPGSAESKFARNEYIKLRKQAGDPVSPEEMDELEQQSGKALYDRTPALQSQIKLLMTNEHQRNMQSERLVAQDKMSKRNIEAKSQEKALDRDIKKKEKADKGPALTKGQEAVDKNFAKTYEKYVAQGGFADTKRQIKQLEDVKKQLGKSDKLTGPIAGTISSIPGVGSVVNPTAVAAKEKVEEVVQRNLRLVLGAQFTEKEGERLISRAYNPMLGEKENKNRLETLIKQMKDAAEAKEAAGKYWNKHGTLTGYTGKPLYQSPDDFLNEVQETSSDPQTSDTVLMEAPNGEQVRVKRDKIDKYIQKGAKVVQ